MLTPKQRAGLAAVQRRSETPEETRARQVRALVGLVDAAIAKSDPRALAMTRDLHELMGFVPGKQQEQTASVQIIVEHTDDASDPAEQAAEPSQPRVH